MQYPVVFVLNGMFWDAGYSPKGVSLEEYATDYSKHMSQPTFVGDISEYRNANTGVFMPVCVVYLFSDVPKKPKVEMQ